ncbi:GMC oxidoreductase-domain-containing protein [Rhodofomes roseus]|uniref:GMC oxidoreductase-domain-containing protein n=1 Tax=Rhodofomes roseus TaxID=34475 RepID=A0ABQ8JYW1_9APHY|nr:GMC oxidoreductase-domain-containing protein [Rhodofomes roseus]KAH9829469.1 GMC oxidoreductase-domain-containing protein [Rhodofomes roseus]
MWPFTDSYPARPLATLRSQYDYIVVGGGTAGCVLARRLSEDQPTCTVLLVERGDASNNFLDTTPLLSIHHMSTGRRSTVIPSTPHARLGRTFPLVCGVGLGGTSRINGGQYTCGVPAQYNAWSDQGRVGWSYDEFKPYFLKSERWTGPVPQEYHGLNGPLEVRSFEGYHYECSRRAADAVRKIGFRDIIDMHSPFEPSIGFNKMQYTVDSTGRRHSAFRAYLPAEVVRGRPNLHVCINVVATRVEFSEGSDGTNSAEGVELESLDRSLKRIITARREIVLSCGALRTPQLLLLSGIGPISHLREKGIRVVRGTPGVGQHLQDHVIIQTTYNCPLSDSLYAMVKQPTTFLRETYNYLRHGAGWFLCTLAEVEIFGLSSVINSDGKPAMLSEEQLNPYNPANLPDFCVLVAPIGDPSIPGVDTTKGVLSINAGLMLSKSFGNVRLGSTDPRVEPLCDMQYLTAPEDRAALRAALRVTNAIARQLREEGYEIDPVRVPDVSSDAAIDEYIDKYVDTMYHYTSTCRMAPEDDVRPGVVDDELRVHGVRKLRVADASVIPNVPAAHPQALVYALAEKCADMMRMSAEPTGL